MLFLSLEHQLFLIITMVFSSYILINAFVFKVQTINLRAFGFTFSIPFFLMIIAFLTAPTRNLKSVSLLFLSQFLLVFLSTVILLMKQNSDALKLFLLLPFVLAGIAPALVVSSYYPVMYMIINLINFALTLINLAFAIHSLITKENRLLPAYLGLFMTSLSLGLWFLLNELTIQSLLLLAMGYSACAAYAYKNTSGTFFIEYEKNLNALKRINGSVQMEVIRRVEGIERSNRKLLEISKTDSMTGFYMKTAVIDSLESALERSPKTSVALLMIDIDKFKRINDSMGHQTGDRCIKNLSSLAQSSFRKEDILGRFGGDEFLVLLPATSPIKAYLIADRFRQLIQNKANPPMTISIGIANYPEDGKTAEALIEAADKALYFSKDRGRNQVTIYSSMKHEPL